MSYVVCATSQFLYLARHWEKISMPELDGFGSDDAFYLFTRQRSAAAEFESEEVAVAAVLRVQSVTPHRLTIHNAATALM